MGCQACRTSEPEKNFNECDLDNNGKNKSPIEVFHSRADPHRSYKEDFQKKFDKNLQYIGNYITVKDFDSIIPPSVHSIMTENALNPGSYLNKNLVTYEVRPVEFPNGNVYWGNWNDKFEMEGLGRYYLKDDKVLAEGVWENGELKYSRVFLPNGDIYEGEISNSTFNGKGKLTSANGEIYQGNFIDGEKTGNGVLLFTDGTEYSGEVKKGEPYGKGRMKWTNGVQYEGGFDGPLLSGYGVLTNLQGEKYEGYFEKNKFHGNGKYNYNNGDVYEGNFENGIKKGKGIFTQQNGLQYEGDWDKDVPYGFGRVNYNGAVLRSAWRNGDVVDELKYEIGRAEDFKDVDLNIKPNDMTLTLNGLTHLENIDIFTSQYKPGTLPSFLNDE